MRKFSVNRGAGRSAVNRISRRQFLSLCPRLSQISVCVCVPLQFFSVRLFGCTSVVVFFSFARWRLFRRATTCGNVNTRERETRTIRRSATCAQKRGKQSETYTYLTKFLCSIKQNMVERCSFFLHIFFQCLSFFLIDFVY